MQILNNRQLTLYNKMVTKAIPDLVKSYSTTYKNYKISLECLPISSRDTEFVEGTKYVMAKCMCEIENIETGDNMQFLLDLLKVPVLEQAGFTIKGNNMQLLDLYDRIACWVFESDYIEDEVDRELTDKRRASLIAVNKSSIRLVVTKNGIQVECKKKKIPISIFLNAISDYTSADFLRMFGTNNKYIVDAFSKNYKKSSSKEGYTSKKGGIPLSKSDCICLVHSKMFENSSKTKNLIDYKNDIHRSLFTKRYLNLGKSYGPRLESSQSFKKRASGKTLVEDIIYNGEIICTAGTILNDDILTEIDLLPINSIKISFSGKVHTLWKFSNLSFRVLGELLSRPIPEFNLSVGDELTVDILNKLNKSDIETIYIKGKLGEEKITRRVNPETLAVEDVLTALGIYANILDNLDTFDNQYELTNRIVVTFDKKILSIIASNLEYVLYKIEKSLKNLTNDDLLLENVSEFNIATDTFINNVIGSGSDKFKEGQMSDLNNSLHLLSKSYKIMTDIDPRNASDDMRVVQDTQLGRTDSIDSPESSKIGLVHERTLFAQETEEGYLTTPYLHVSNGIVLSEEPIYLTAQEEQNVYIAEWNEEFFAEDGNLKPSIQARYNGAIVTVDTNLVTYKEYTQLQNMSPARALLPFMGNSNAKRLLMACNHGKQALPKVKIQRPIVGTGAECIIDTGNVYGKNILEKYILEAEIDYPDIRNYEDTINKSVIHLAQNGIYEGHNVREYTFVVDNIAYINAKEGTQYPQTIVISTQYLQKTSEKSIFTFRIKPAKTYSPEDLVIYNMTYDTKSYTIEGKPNFGAFKMDEKMLQGAYGAGTNLVVGYKTFTGTTIDDAISISSDLVYEDTETTITIFTEKIELHRGEDYTEVFGYVKSSQDLEGYHYNSKIGTNGLAIVGETLKPGDPFVCITKISPGKPNICTYKYLNEVTEGQVVSAERKEDGDKVYAEIKLASRSAIEVGDKMAGRCGNKGVVARIIPAEQMPFDPKTGLKLDLVLNPLGIPSRMNITQLLEVTLAFAMKLKGEDHIVIKSPYDGNSLEYVEAEAEKMGVKPMYLCDGRTGRMFERPICVGIQYMQKLVHRVSKKMAAISFDAPTDAIFGQPIKGQSRQGGQSFGEMESWCLQSIGAYKVLQSLYTVQSDDAEGREDLICNIQQNPFEYNHFGNNRNDLVFQAFTRSLCVDTIVDNDSYSFEPLRDYKIKSLSARPVVTENDLHNQTLFSKNGEGNNKSLWSYIELNTKIVSPYWLFKGNLHNYFIVVQANNTKNMANSKVLPSPMSNKLFEKLLKNEALVEFGKKYPIIYEDSVKESAPENCLTGMTAIIKLFETTDIFLAKEYYECEVNKFEMKYSMDKLQNNTDYLKMLKKLKYVNNFIASNTSISDFIITAYPVMPEAFRQNLMSSKMKSSDFDKSYREIIKAAKSIKQSATEENIMHLMRELDLLIGLGKLSDPNTRKQERSSILKWFSGGKSKSNRKGKIREHMLSKRIFCSGRAVITPTQLEKMKPTEIGIPIAMIVKIYKQPLISYLNSKFKLQVPKKYRKIWERLFSAIGTQNRHKFYEVLNENSYFVEQFKLNANVEKEQIYSVLMEEIRNYVEGTDTLPPQVVIAGRQPSLHVFSIRAFKPIIVYTKSIQVHPLVCGGYNADFDGDTMWVAAIYGKEAQEEAIELMSPSYGFINPKDGEPIMDPKQDIVLGIYGATMLKDNAISVYQHPEIVKDVHLYTSISDMEVDIEMGFLSYYSLVQYRRNNKVYYSTAGRILFNNCIPEGFTDKTFSNILHLPIDNYNVFGEHTALCDLKYDGIVAAKGGTRAEIEYCNLGKVCIEIYEEYGSDSVKYYQNLTEFGFKASDKISVTLSLKDVDVKMDIKEIQKIYDADSELLHKMLEKNILTDFQYAKKQKAITERYKAAIDNRNFSTDAQENIKKLLMREADDKVVKLQKYYQMGLLSVSDRKEGTTRIYSQACSKLKNALPMSMPRNNNLFIIYDSGARGNTGQLMQTAGAIGILQKTNKEDMETAITKNYTEGISSFDMHTSSYSARVGVVSTQNETPDAGYATRIAVNMENCVKVLEDDCGKENWWLEIIYGELKSIRWYPSREWFIKEILNKRINPEDLHTMNIFGDSIVDNRITEAGYMKIKDGFDTFTIITEDGEKRSYENDLNALKSSKVLDKDTLEELKYFLDRNIINSKCIEIIKKHHISHIETDIGVFELRYKMDDAMKSLIRNRIASPTERNGLPGLKYLREYKALKGSCYIVTNKTIDYIEDMAIKIAPIRILLDCRTEHGVCAKCYGLRYTNMKLPKVGEDVGIEAAQAMGEPSAQLTMSLFHKGGSAGESIAGGVEILKHLLEGGNPGGSRAIPANVSDKSGYVYMRHLDEKSMILVRPKDSEASVCKQCKLNNQGKCAIENANYSEALCKLDDKVLTNRLIIDDNEYIHAGDQITDGYLLPNSITKVENNNLETLLRKKQISWFLIYFNTFKSNGININARHFEILARIQNFTVTVIKDPSNTYEKGEVIEIFNAMRENGIEKVNNMDFNIATARRYDVIEHNSGNLAMFCFENVAESIASAVTQAKTDTVISPIASTFIGNDLRYPNRKKKLAQPDIDFTESFRNPYDNVEPGDLFNENTYIEISDEEIEIEVNKLEFNLDNLDIFGELDGFEDLAEPIDSLKALQQEEEVVKETPSTEEKYKDILELEELNLFSDVNRKNINSLKTEESIKFNEDLVELDLFDDDFPINLPQKLEPEDVTEEDNILALDDIEKEDENSNKNKSSLDKMSIF